MDISIPSILRLPSELLLEVLNHISGLPRDRQQDILNISITCKHLRPIALEVLLVHPIINIPHIAEAVHLYFLHPSCIPKVRTLEIVSATSTTDQNQIMSEMRLASDTNETLSKPAFRRFCQAIIETCASSSQHSTNWTEDLQSNNCQAHLGLLFAMLPNLSQLLLGPNFLHYYPMFNALICDREAERKGLARALQNRPPYLDDILNALRQKLVELELPVLWNIEHTAYRPDDESRGTGNIQNHLAPISHLSLPHFTHIRILTMPCFALGQYRVTRPMSRYFPKSMFPPSLQILRVIDANHVPITNFLRPVLQNAAASPGLQRVEVYFHNHKEDLDCRQREEDLQVLARNARVELYIRHPHPPKGSIQHISRRYDPIFEAMDAHGQPWRYTEKELLQLEIEASRRRHAD